MTPSCEIDAQAETNMNASSHILDVVHAVPPDSHVQDLHIVVLCRGLLQPISPIYSKIFYVIGRGEIYANEGNRSIMG